MRLKKHFSQTMEVVKLQVANFLQIPAMAFKLVLLLGLAGACSASLRLQERYAWNALDWNFPDEYSRQQALYSGAFVPENALPVGIERWKNKLFVSVPRWRAGKFFIWFFFFNKVRLVLLVIYTGYKRGIL